MIATPECKTGSMNNRQHSDNRSIDEQASAWFVRLRADDVTSEERQQFEAWLKQSEAHAKAYDKIVTMWALLKTPAQNVRATLQSEGHEQIIHRKRFSAKRSITLLLILLIVFFQLPAQLQNWRSDYHTVAGEQLDVVLDDGSRVLLNTDSALQVAYSAGQRRVELLRGEAYFEVEADKTRPFLVVHGGIAAKAVGTAFSVKTDDEVAQVVVSEGIVEVSAPQTEPVLLVENQLSAYQQGRSNIVVNSDIAKEFSWQRGQLVFNQQPLVSVIDEVNRYRNGQIIIVNPRLKQRIVSGVFDITDADAVVDALTSTLHVNAVALAGRLVMIY